MSDLAQIKAFLLDMDGTIYVDDKLLPQAQDFLAFLDEQRLSYIFLTNNSSARAADYRLKLERLGIKATDKKILTSGEATVHYLLQHTALRKVFLLGTPSLQAEFIDAGFELTDQDPQCVVLGFDKTLTYERLAKACLVLARGLPYFATHPDFTCITQQGYIPDTGAFIVGIEKVTGRLPKIIGKPQPEMVEAALARLGSAAPYTAMVGDQLDTDMTMAQQAGLCGILVLSGETSPQRLAAQSLIKPRFVLDNIGELLRELKAARK